MNSFDILATLAQAAFGALVVMNLRNDVDEYAGGIRFGRATWTGMALIGAALLIGLDFIPERGWLWGGLSLFVAMGFFGYALTAPHGQVLQGPYQIIPPEEDDPVFAAAMWLTNHKGGAGDVLGWPAWLVYNTLRYVLPMLFLGVMLHSWVVGVSGVMIVASYWPLAYVPWVNERWDTRFFGAFMCGAWLFVGL